MDYTYLYSTRIQKTFDEDQADILSVLRAEYEKNPNTELQLINYYKGMPVSFTAKMAGIDKYSIDLDSQPLLVTAVSSEHYTFIRSKLFKHDIVANVQYYNLRRKAILLRRFCFVEIIADRRKHIRLQLENPINALFNSSSGIIRGKLIELSMGGALMSVEQTYNEIIDEEVNLSLMVPDLIQNVTYNIKVPSKLLRVSDESKARHFRLAFTVDDKTSDRVIAKYLYHRQVEIIHELKNTYELALQKAPKILETMQSVNEPEE